MAPRWRNAQQRRRIFAASPLSYLMEGMRWHRMGDIPVGMGVTGASTAITYSP